MSLLDYAAGSQSSALSVGTEAFWPGPCRLPGTRMRTDPKPLFLLPCACCIMRLGREKCVSSFLLLGSARTVAVIPTRITGNMKSVLRSTPQVCYLLGFFFFFCLFLMTQTWPCSREHFGSLPVSSAPAARACWRPAACWGDALRGLARPRPVLAALRDFAAMQQCFKKQFTV